MKYYICYNTGAGDFEFEGTIEQAMAAADEGVAYTQENVTIADEDGNDVMMRSWWDVAYDPDEDDSDEDEIIEFGSFGYYGAWRDI